MLSAQRCRLHDLMSSGTSGELSTESHLEMSLERGEPGEDASCQQQSLPQVAQAEEVLCDAG